MSVHLYHPKLARWITATVSAARVHRQSGWVDAGRAPREVNEFQGPTGAPDEPATVADNPTAPEEE